MSQADSALAPCAADDENDVRIAALNALLQMDSERALPILQKVLSRRDACSVELRRKALFLVSQKEAPASTDMLIAAARQDPEASVREQAVFWLSQAKDPRVVGMLDSIATHDGDESVRKKCCSPYRNRMIRRRSPCSAGLLNVMVPPRGSGRRPFSGSDRKIAIAVRRISSSSSVASPTMT